MAGRHRTAIVVYLVCFAVALRVFLVGHHALALGIVFVAWAILSAWLYFGGGR
jgi:hypothetical protein